MAFFSVFIKVDNRCIHIIAFTIYEQVLIRSGELLEICMDFSTNYVQVEGATPDRPWRKNRRMKKKNVKKEQAQPKEMRRRKKKRRKKKKKKKQS